MRQLLIWYGGAQGPAAVARIFAAIPVEYSRMVHKDREAFGLLPATWYPSPLLHAIVEAMVVGGYEPSVLARDSADAIMSATLTGLHRAFFQRLATPRLYARYANLAWSMYHDSGRCELEVVDDGHIEARVTGWLGHHPIVCEMNIYASIPIFAAMKCRNVRVQRTACVSRDSPLCTSTIRWSRER